jgi:hypothetical protein
MPEILIGQLLFLMLPCFSTLPQFLLFLHGVVQDGGR